MVYSKKSGYCCHPNLNSAKLIDMVNPNPITPEQVQTLRDLIQARVGLDIEMRTSIQLPKLLAELAQENPSEYLTLLASQPDYTPAWQRLIEELTIGETYFFRNQTQFQLLREHILPELIRTNVNHRQLVIWSAGCSTGEELYSVVLTLLDLLPPGEKWRVTAVGTDISQKSINAARRGMYRNWSFRHDDYLFLKTYFTEIDGGYLLRDDVRREVTFRQGNILKNTITNWADLILCRNVMLYFTRDAKYRAEQNILSTLRPKGWLLLGHAEALHAERESWITHIFSGAITYQKPDPNESQSLSFQYHKDANARHTDTKHPMRKQDATPEYTEALTSFQEKRYERTEHMLGEILNRRPQNTQARVLLAAVFANQGAQPEAVSHLDIVLYQAPLHADAHYLRAVLYLEAGEPDKAEKSLRAALYSQQGHPLAAYLLGNIHAQNGDNRRAYNLWKQAHESACNLPADQRLTDFSPYTAKEFATLVANTLPRNSTGPLTQKN
jgi:chemotaxis protein methyltransferase CheR